MRASYTFSRAYDTRSLTSSIATSNPALAKVAARVMLAVLANAVAGCFLACALLEKGARADFYAVLLNVDEDASGPGGTAMVAIDRGTPGVTLGEDFTSLDGSRHTQVTFNDVRVPYSNVLLGEGRGFEIAQGRLGPGRVHHCMRLIGSAERALEMMIGRARDRVAFGRPLIEQGTVRRDIAESRLAIDQARLLVLHTARRIDREGARAARREIAMIKAVVPRTALDIIDRAIQLHGGLGVSSDIPLTRFWIYARSLRIADGPDEVHLETVAKHAIAARADISVKHAPPTD